jgi:hypothetical protein
MLPVWMAALVIILHLIEPHDHHKNEISHQEQDHCSDPTEQSGRSSGMPVHCVILNDITIEKITPSFIADHQLPTFDLFFDIQPGFSTENIVRITSLFIHYSEGITDEDFHIIPNFRAPPFIA